MKPTIRRDIQSRHRSATVDGPRIGRVSRLRGSEGPRPVRWTRRRGEGHHRPDAGFFENHPNLCWSIVFVVVTALVIMGFALFWLRSNRSAPVVLDTGRVFENVRVASRFASPSEDEALALVKKALATRDPDRVGETMRAGVSTPAEVVEFMAALETSDGPIKRIAWLSSMDVDDMLMDGVLVTLGDAKIMERIAFLVPDENGVWKVDFDAFARVSEPTWREFLQSGAETACVRVMVTGYSYYNGPFADESRWSSYALSSSEAKKWLPEGNEFLRGYCAKETPQAMAMERMFKGGAKMRRALLEISKTEGADSRQFEITRVLAEDWVLPPVPFDERFN
jgi:hypothetical protein